MDHRQTAEARQRVPPATERTILIVDDEEDVRETLAQYLVDTMPRVRVRQAASGDQALPILERETVHLLITDFRMPGMTGLDLLEIARFHWPKLPTLMMTAYPDIDLATEAVNEQRVSYFMVKPLDPDKVMHWVADTLWRCYLQEMRDFALTEAVDLLGEMARSPPDDAAAKPTAHHEPVAGSR